MRVFRRAPARVTLAGTALAFVAVSCAAAPEPGKGRVIDKDGKPVAGAHTLMWRDAIRSWEFSFFGRSPRSSCVEESYALSDANGEFVIPPYVISRPLFASKSGIRGDVYVPGMVAESKVISGEDLITFDAPLKL